MTAPLVMILAGAGDPSWVWAETAEAIRDEGVACEVVELPMKGVNVEPQPTSIEAYGRWFEQMIDGRGMSEIVLVGHSMGALIALEVAASGTAPLVHVVMMCPAAPMFVHESLLVAGENDPSSAASMIARWSYAPTRRAELADIIGRHVAATSSLEPGVLATDLHACNDYSTAPQAASRVSIPSTVILSGDDHMTPRASAMPIIDRLKTPVVHVLEGAGHAIEHERPREVASIISGVASVHTVG